MFLIRIQRQLSEPVNQKKGNKMAEKNGSKSGNTERPNHQSQKPVSFPGRSGERERLRDHKVLDPYRAPAKVTRPSKDETK